MKTHINSQSQLIDLCSCGFTLKLIAWVIDICPSYSITLNFYDSNNYYSFCCLTALLLEIWMLKRFLEVWSKVKGFYFCARNLVSVAGNQNYSFWFSDHMPQSSNSKSRKIFENLNLSLPVLILCLQGDMHNLKALFWWGFLIARSSDEGDTDTSKNYRLISIGHQNNKLIWSIQVKKILTSIQCCIL